MSQLCGHNIPVPDTSNYPVSTVSVKGEFHRQPGTTTINMLKEQRGNTPGLWKDHGEGQSFKV